MRIFSQIISYIFHPIFIPIAGTLAFFALVPYSTLELQSGNVLPIFILTIIIPIICFLILKNLGIVNSIMLPNLAERKYPLYISIALLLMVLFRVIPNNYTVELYFYFLGLIAALSGILLLLFLNFKASIHMMAMGSFLMFLINLSIHFEKNITIAISLFTIITGLVATSRLFLKAHSRPELLVGLLLGVVSQFLTVTFWL